MTDANPVTYDARNPQTPAPATAASAVTGRPKLACMRAYPRPAAESATAGWQVREEPEHYIPDLLSDRDAAPDLAHIAAPCPEAAVRTGELVKLGG